MTLSTHDDDDFTVDKDNMRKLLTPLMAIDQQMSTRGAYIQVLPHV